MLPLVARVQRLVDKEMPLYNSCQEVNFTLRVKWEWKWTLTASSQKNTLTDRKHRGYQSPLRYHVPPHPVSNVKTHSETRSTFTIFSDISLFFSCLSSQDMHPPLNEPPVCKDILQNSDNMRSFFHRSFEILKVTIFSTFKKKTIQFRDEVRNDKLTLNTVEVNLKAWAQLCICYPFKLLGKSVDCTLERFMPLDLCFYCSGVYRFTVAAHPDSWICR